MGSCNFESRPRPTSYLGFAAILSVVSACNLTKKEDPAPVATAVIPAAPVFNVTPTPTLAPTPGVATPEPSPARAPEVKGKATTGGAGGATAKGTSTPQAGGSTSAAATTNAGGSTAKTTTAAATLPTIDMGCINGCATKFQACVAAAGLDGTKLAACQSVVTNCQTECKAK